MKDATTDPGRIRAWWEAEPLANVAVAMGGPLRLLAVDVDPRSGGDASLCDLVEAHGHEWLETFTVRTGGLGHHFIFRLPEGVEVHRAKLAPGIDVKAEGGYLVAAPSLHASGRRYVVERDAAAAEAPAWLVEELTRATTSAPARVIKFQEGRRARAGDPLRIAEGERNRRVFEIGCAIWGAGEAADVGQLYARLIEEAYPRCDAGEKPFTPEDVWKIANSIMRYPRGVPKPGGEAA